MKTPNDKLFHSICFDNFFEDPDLIRDWALSLQYYKDPEGRWPGERTKGLHDIHNDLNTYFLSKFFSIYYSDRNFKVSWEDSCVVFQKILPYTNNKNDQQNIGWVHKDGEYNLAGIVYLTPDADIDTGTSLYNLKSEFKLTYNDEVTNKSQENKFKLYLNKEIDVNEYNNQQNKFNNMFYEKTRFNNVYNRLIGYDAQEFHKANNFVNSNKKERLTLVWFIKGLTVSHSPVIFTKSLDSFENTVKQLKNESV